MPGKKPPLTHTGIVVTNSGNKRVKLRMTATTWCAEGGRYYYRTDGMRGGSTSYKNRLLLDTIRPLAVSPEEDTTRADTAETGKA